MNTTRTENREQAMDDFSFPTIAADQEFHCQRPFPHFAASPVWLFSSVMTEPESESMQRRSLSVAAETPELTRDFREGSMETEPLGQEERMDMLWEDFNEEPHRMSSELRGSSNKMNNRDQIDRKQEIMMELCCVRALTESKNGSMIRHRKTGLILMMKALRKLFLIDKS